MRTMALCAWLAAVQALAIEARNGAVKLEDCETGSLAVQAFNGAVHLQRLRAAVRRCRA